MKTIITENYDDLSQLVASILLAEMAKDKCSNISITAGSSPVRTYEILEEMLKGKTSILDNNYFYNFDEMKTKNEEEGITIRELRRQFYNPLTISKDSIVQLTYDNYQEYDQIINDNGGLDLMVIGMGADGHFCGNMPYATDFSKMTYKLEFKPEYPWYEKLGTLYRDGEYPEYSVTMGLQSLLRVKHLVLIANGEGKAETVKRMLESDEVTNEFPVSALKAHPNITIILDKEAAMLLK